MTPCDLRSARKALGLTCQGLAVLLCVSDGRTVRRWEAGDRDIPGPVAVLLELLLKSRSARWELNLPTHLR